MTETEKEFESYTGPASLSPIPLSIGSVPIRPADKNQIKANAVEAMHHYAQQEIDNQVYHLYEKDDHYTLSLIGPKEWGRSKTVLKYIASVKLLGDHSWQVIEKGND